MDRQDSTIVPYSSTCRGFGAGVSTFIVVSTDVLLTYSFPKIPFSGLIFPYFRVTGHIRDSHLPRRGDTECSAICPYQERAWNTEHTGIKKKIEERREEKHTLWIL